MDKAGQDAQTNGTKWDQVTVDAFGVPRRRFHIGDVLSITTGRLVSPRHMEGVCDILGFMTGQQLYTHDLPAAADACRRYLDDQIPALSGKAMAGRVALLEVQLAARGENGVRAWLAAEVKKHGASVEVMPLQGKPSERWTKEAARG